VNGADYDNVRLAFEKVVDELGPVDVLVTFWDLLFTQSPRWLGKKRMKNSRLRLPGEGLLGLRIDHIDGRGGSTRKFTSKAEKEQNEWISSLPSDRSY